MDVAVEDITRKKQTTERVAYALIKAAHPLLIKGATPVEVDEALVEFGFRMGPFEAQDLQGLEAAYQIRKASGVDRTSRTYLESGMMISDRMVEEGRLGKVSGVGWYRYPGGKGKVDDPLMEDLIREEAHFAGIAQQLVTRGQIVEAMLRALRIEIEMMNGEVSMVSPNDLEQICIDAFGVDFSKINYSRQTGCQ